MRIAVDAGPLAAPMGGIRRYTESLLHGLARIDRSNRYLLYNLPSSVEPLWFGENFTHVAAPVGLLRLLRYIRLPCDADLVHGTNYTAPVVDRRPLVLTIHDLTVHLLPQTHPTARRVLHRMLPVLCRRARRIIAVSHTTKRDLVYHYRVAPEKINVIYLSVDASFHPVRDAKMLASVRSRYNLPGRFALFVGCIEPRKNLSALLQPLRVLKASGMGLALVIAGRAEPEYQRQLRHRIRLAGLSEPHDVVFTGPVPEGDLSALYSLSEMVVYPSLYEGFGLPPLEAMACGTPVVLPRNSSLAELYEGSGLLVDLSDPKGLAEAIRNLTGCSELRSYYVERGLKFAQSRTWDDAAAETLQVYEKSLRDSRI